MDTLYEAAEAAFDSETSNEVETEVQSSVEETEVEQPFEESTEVTEEPQVDDKSEEVEEAPVEETPEDDEESFSSFNPDELPEEMLAVYKSLQADYTRKRQADSQKVKDLEAKIEELSKQQSSEVKQAVEEGELPAGWEDMSEAEKLRFVARAEVKAEQERNWEQQAQKDIESIEPRLNENHPDFDPMFDDYARSRLDRKLSDYVKDMETKVGFDYKVALKEIGENWADYVGKLNKSYIAKQKALAKEKEAELKKAAPKVSKAPAKANTTMDFNEAVEAAFSEQV
jgi:hypothetical protein